MSDPWRRTQIQLGEFFAAVEPWLLELGNWIFGALIGFNLVILGAVLTIGPVDTAVRIATAAFAFALPPSAVGLVILRLVADVRNIRSSQTATQAIHAAGVEVGASETDREAASARRKTIVFRYAVALMAVTLVLTIAGLTATLWHTAPWIGLAFLAVLVLSLGTLAIATIQLGGRGPKLS